MLDRKPHVVYYLDMEPTQKQTREEINETMDFRRALLNARSYEPLEVGKEYAFRAYTDLRSHNRLVRTATQADIDAVEAATKSGNLNAFDRPGQWR